MQNIYATSLNYKGKAVLLTGASGSGKSDIALRLIMRYAARLIADDRTNIEAKNGLLKASAPKNIAGLLEVRGIGIQKLPFDKEGDVILYVELTKDSKEIERMPEEHFIELEGVKIPAIKLLAFEDSAPEKIVIKMDSLLD